MKKISFVLIVLFTLSACGSLGPMQRFQGPIGTPVFDIIALQKINDGSEEILFKEMARMYDEQDVIENKYASNYGSFIITEKGIYVMSWDNKNYQYNKLFSLPINDIDSLLEANASVMVWVDSNILIIKDKYGEKTGFHMQGRIAAKSIINNLLSKKIS
jgi:hypothetical protein